MELSSIVYLGFSVITFAIIYGIAFMLMPTILGSYFTSIDPNLIHSNADWLAMYQTHEETAKYLVPLIPTLGIFILVLKVIMTAAARGRE